MRWNLGSKNLWCSAKRFEIVARLMKRAFSPTLFAIVFGLLTAASAQFSGNGASPSVTPSFGSVQSSGTGAAGGSPAETPFYQQSNSLYSGSGAPIGRPYGGSVSNFSEQYTPALPIIAPMPHYWILIGSILLLALSLYLFMQSIELQRFAFRRIAKSAPNPRSGFQLVWVSVVAVVLVFGGLSCLNYMQQYPMGENQKLEVNETTFAFLGRLLFFEQPLSLVPAFALASLLPSALAAYKFLVVKTVGRGQDRSETRSRFSIGSALIGFVLATINLAASVAGLVAYWKTGK